MHYQSAEDIGLIHSTQLHLFWPTLNHLYVQQTRYESCSWGVSPGNALVVSSAMDVRERDAIQRFLGAAVDQYGGKGGFVDANVVDTDRQQDAFDDYGDRRQQGQGPIQKDSHISENYTWCEAPG